MTFGTKLDDDEKYFVGLSIGNESGASLVFQYFYNRRLALLLFGRVAEMMKDPKIEYKLANNPMAALANYDRA